MLRTISLDGFRCFGSPTSVELSKITVLTGVNNVGKSSIIQAVMALMQSEQQASGDLLRLTGEWVQIGSFKQNVNYGLVGPERRFSIGMDGHDGQNDINVLWTFVDAEDPTADTAQIEKVDALIGDLSIHVHREHGGHVIEQDSELTPTSFLHPGRVGKLSGINLFPCHFGQVLYLGASRISPQKLYEPRRSSLGPLAGAMGENTAEVLLKNRRAVVDVLPYQTDAPALLGAALNAWWSHIFERPFTLRVEAPQNLGFTLSLDTPSAENLSLGQVGLGLSQVLPVITLALCSRSGDLVVIDTPEAHLHPGAQHRLMDMLISLARADRQVVLETHSDHIVNALRLAVKRGESDGGLRPDDVSIQYFGREEGGGAVERIPLDVSGRLTRWPEGFFDQAAQTLLRIIE